MQVIRDEDKNSNVYIKSFKKDHKYITMKMADNSKPRYLNVEDVEVKTIELMWNQHFLNMEELPNLYYKHQVAKSIMLASLVLLICFIGLNLPNLGLNSYLIPLGILSSTLISANSMMKNAAKIIELKKEGFLAQKKNTLLLVGRYDRYSKYSSKNMARYIGEREVFTVPYSTLFFEAANEGKVADFFLRFRKIDENDRNAIFISEIKKVSNKIIYKLQELKMRM